jgi:hypothetical protein
MVHEQSVGDVVADQVAGVLLTGVVQESRSWVAARTPDAVADLRSSGDEYATSTSALATYR